VGPDAKRTLQTAAVIGKDFALPLLERVSDLEPEALAASLDALKDAEFIYEQSIYPEVEYTFKHALTQEVASQGLLAERRRELHGRVGEAIESLYPTRQDENVGALAHHFAQSGDEEKAVHYLRLAGVRAGRLGAWPEAKGLLEDARIRARALPASEERDRRRMAVLRVLDRGVLILAEEGWEAHLEGIDEELTEVATSLGAFGELAWSFSSRAVALGALMGPRGPLRCADKVRGLAGLLSDEDVAWYAGQAESYACYLRGEFRAALATLRELLKRSDIDHLAPPSDLSTVSQAAFLFFRAVLSLNNLGEFEEAESLLARFRELIAEDETPIQLGNLRTLEGWHLLARGQPEPAARAFAEAIGHWGRAGRLRGSGGARIRLGRALTELGKFKEASDALNEALEILGGSGWFSAQVFPHRARAYLGAGQVAEARQDAETGIAVARQFENRAGEGEAHLSLALVLGASEPPDYAAAEQEFAEAEQCLRDCEYRTELALALRCHGELRLKTDGPGAAEPLLEEARALYAWMGRERDVAAVETLLGRTPLGHSPAAAKTRDG
jgi:tetratricopeptide (TPR) repeat protein